MDEIASLAEEIGAEIQFAIPALAKRIADQRTEYKEFCEHMREAQTLVSIQPERKMKRSTVSGVSSRSRVIPFHSYRLFGISAVHQPIRIDGSSIEILGENSTFEIDTVGQAAWGRRVGWTRIIRALDVAEHGLQMKPDIALLNFSLGLSRGIETATDMPELAQEWDQFIKRYRKFWTIVSGKILPQNPNGPLLVSWNENLSHRYLRGYLTSLERDVGIPSVGKSSFDTSCLLHIALSSYSRTKPFETEHSCMSSINGKMIPEEGLSVFYCRGASSSLYQVELPGKPEDWKSSILDYLCRIAFSLTFFGASRNTPFPIWLAKRKSKFSKKLLYYAAKRINKEIGTD